MATKATAPKLTAAQMKDKIIRLEDKVDSLKNGAWCYMCDTHKSRDKFYVSTDPLNKSGLTPICKDCAKKIALKIGKDKVEHEPDKDSVILALKYLDKPFLNDLWDASVLEADNLASGRVKSNPWNAYIKNVAMGQYNCKTFSDSDFYYSKKDENNDNIDDTSNSFSVNKDLLDTFTQNKKDVIRLLGYDPFEKEQPGDQPYLYASLIGYLDSSEDANEDRLKTSSSIEIVKSFSHIEKINDVITSLMSDVKNMEKNISTIKNLEDTKNKITSSVLNLAKDNGISLKHSVNASKGENTWTGKVRKMKEMNLSEAETNLYNIEYSAGLQQVAEISDAAILKQIRLDENDYNDMIIQQRELINKYKKKSDESEEKSRILLKENYDLKSLLKDNNIDLVETNNA
nr:MAG: Stc1 domain [Bacteriophage sp.]